MALFRGISRLSSRLRPIALNFTKPPSQSVPLKSTTPSVTRISRLPVELSCCVESLMPLHSAIASARLKSSLSVESKCWGLIPQGLSMPL